jgi:hypothetical protein
MKIVVQEGQAQSPSDTSGQHARTEYEVDLDYEGALSLMSRLRSSGTYIHFAPQNYRIDFRLDPDEPIEVEIMSIVDEFWAMSEVSDSRLNQFSEWLIAEKNSPKSFPARKWNGAHGATAQDCRAN